LARGSVKNVTEIFRRRKNKEAILRALEDGSDAVLAEKDDQLL
jgi:hypothetical protein